MSRSVGACSADHALADRGAGCTQDYWALRRSECKDFTLREDLPGRVR